MGKSFEYWAVMLAMILWLATRDAERESIMRRITKTAASGALAYGLSPFFAPYLKDSEEMAVVLVMGVGLIALDVLTALIGDREFLKDLLKQRFGGKK